jgi:hypothetical protein
MKKFVFSILMLPMLSFGMDRMTALSMIETGHNDRMVGRAGEISRYQILKNEWRAVTKSRHYTNPTIARTVATRILDNRLERFQAIYEREPTDFEFYALWNAPSQVLRGRVSSRVAERCHRFANLCGLSREPVRTVQARAGSSEGRM